MADVETTKAVGELQSIGDRKLYSYSSKYTRIPDTKKVTVHHLTKCGDDRLAFHGYVLDLTNVSEDDALENEAKNINIQFVRPRVFRIMKAQDVLSKYDEVVEIDAAEIMAQTNRKVKDPVVACANIQAKMSKEQMAEAIKNMEAAMAARS